MVEVKHKDSVTHKMMWVFYLLDYFGEEILLSEEKREGKRVYSLEDGSFKSKDLLDEAGLPLFKPGTKLKITLEVIDD